MRDRDQGDEPEGVHGALMVQQPAAIAHGNNAHAMAERAKAHVLARFHMAMIRPRDPMQVRATLLKEVELPALAEIAEYCIPRGGKDIRGPSIHLARAARRAMKNLEIFSEIIDEDTESRTVRCTALDLENNVSESLEFRLRLVQERKQLRRDQKPVGTRVNSEGQTVYLVEVSEQELLMAQRAQEARAFRSCILGLCPGGLIDEARAVAKAVREAKIKRDPAAEIKRIVDAFDDLGVTPENLAAYLGAPITQCAPAQIEQLRAVYETVKTGELVWSAIQADAERRRADAAGFSDNKSKSPILETIERKAAAREQRKNGGAKVEPPSAAERMPSAAHDQVTGAKWREWKLKGERWHGEWEWPQQELYGVISCLPGGEDVAHVSGNSLPDELRTFVRYAWA
jgi:hypothetical protein